MNKKKLILAMYIGVITLAVASVSMSVAWYAASRTLYINGINISIDTDRDLKISSSLDGDYVERIDHTEREANGVFFPTTSAHSHEWMSTQSDMPIFYDESRSYEQENAVTYTRTDSGFFSEKFYLLADDDLYITLDAEKTFIEANEAYNASYAEFLFNEYQAHQDAHYKDYSKEELYEMLNRVVKAMRYSILIKDENEYSYTIIDPHLEGETLLGGLLDNDSDLYYDFYTKEGSDEQYERVYGEVIGDKSLYVYDEALSSDSEILDSTTPPNAFNAHHKANVKRFNLEESLNKGLEIKKEEAIGLENFTANDFRFPVYRNKPKEIVISIYIEGWDKECVNYTMGAAFVSNLTFKIEREM